MIIKFTEKDMEKIEGISSLYDVIAMTVDPEADLDSLQYDCTKVLVSENIQTTFFDLMKDKGYSDTDIAMYWCMCGPKVNKELKDMEVEIQEGFFCNSSNKAN